MLARLESVLRIFHHDPFHNKVVLITQNRRLCTHSPNLGDINLTILPYKT
jgi:hypothetical protein